MQAITMQPNLLSLVWPEHVVLAFSDEVMLATLVIRPFPAEGIGEVGCPVEISVLASLITRLKAKDG